jgi:hypothetical protein
MRRLCPARLYVRAVDASHAIRILDAPFEHDRRADDDRSYGGTTGR